MSDKISIAKREQANAIFRDHVQSIAFHLTLSRRMIDCLAAIRECEPGLSSRWSEQMAQNGRFVPDAHALIRRGLVYHDWRQGWPKDHKIYNLTKAGELVCDLCVEAGLMAPRVEQKKRKAAA